MSDTITGSTGGKWGRHRRRRWMRSTAAQRAGAAATLKDIFTPRRYGKNVLPVVLALSLALHGAMVPLLAMRKGASAEEIKAGDKSYLSKILAKERAAMVTQQVSRTHKPAPPPPPDPANVVQNAMTTEIDHDLTKVTMAVLDVRHQKDLLKHVTRTLDAELKELADNVAKGKLSDAEIRAAQENIRKNAQKEALNWRQENRETEQVEVTSLSVTDWYEARLSRVLTKKMRLELDRGCWQLLRDVGIYQETLPRETDYLSKLLEGTFSDPQNEFPDCESKGGSWKAFPSWPRPDAKQARLLEAQLKATFERWGEAEKQYLRVYYAHDEARRRTYAATMASEWKATLDAAAAYYYNTSGTKDAAKIEAARSELMARLKKLQAEAGSIYVRATDKQQAVIRAVRSNVLRAERDNMYAYLISKVLMGIRPALRDVLESNVREGILVRKQGIDQTSEEMVQSILPLFERDFKEACAKPEFNVRVFATPYNPYRNRQTGANCPPDEEQIKADDDKMQSIMKEWANTPLKNYPDLMAEMVRADFKNHLDAVVKGLLERITDEGRLWRGFYSESESVDYRDVMKEKLDARGRAMRGRKQDLADLTEQGLPDTTATMTALTFGASRGHGASLQPQFAGMEPFYLPSFRPAMALRGGEALYPPPPGKWGFETQAQVPCPFKDSPVMEAIPFLTTLPSLDGDLSEWVKVRPLKLTHANPDLEEKVGLLYAGWNYQGFFFAYEVKNDPKPHRKYTRVSPVTFRNGGFQKNEEGWQGMGDGLRLWFDTLDARLPNRGEANTQEFLILPGGCDTDEDFPGTERIIATQRDAVAAKNISQAIRATTKAFPSQVSAGYRMNEKSPYRVARFTNAGYSCEVFLPRTLFNVPVFAPGWYIGFTAGISVGQQAWNEGAGCGWGWTRPGRWWNNDAPNTWGDLLLLGTDPRIVVQDTDGAETLCIIPGRSYLLTVIDPVRNVDPLHEDIVLMSAEVKGAQRSAEVFILKETKKNNSIFRGYVNTQPGLSRSIQGVLEVMPGDEVCLGYISLANSKGQRNAQYLVRLPVVSTLMETAKAR